jgi:CheY-like chemotaxis protein
MKTVLIVDDDPAIVALLHRVVERDGYAVLDATSAEQAFERFEDSDAQVDLLIADVTLGSSSGIRVALELWALLPNLRTIISSGYPQSMWPGQDAAELDEYPSGLVAVLQKPFVPAAMLDTVHRLIGWPCEMAPALKVNVAS